MDCGIFGMAGLENTALKIFFGLYDLQHRGEQAAGMAVSNGKRIRAYKEEGLVSEALGDEEILNQLNGRLGIGHNRYSTIGDIEDKAKASNIQPIEGKFRGEPFFIAHNGNLIDFDDLKREAGERGYSFKTYSEKTGKILDTEIITALLSTSSKPDFLEALLEVLPRLKGSFSLIILLKDKVIGVRGQYGIRPLCLGKDESGFVLASESCAFHTIKASFIRDLQPGEIIVLDENGISNQFVWAANPQLRLCVFELVYFARPDSVIDGATPYFHRLKAGEFCAKENPAKGNLVTSIPESGEIYNLGFSRTSGIPVERAIFRNRYFLGSMFLLSKKSKRFSRTFLTSRDTDRRKIQQSKFYCLRKVVHEKKVIVTDDSLIRGSVAPEIVAMLRKQGAKEVHLRICSPPIRHPCFLGIDTATYGELIAASLPIEGIRKHVEADSLGYLSIKSLIRASGLPKEKLCLGCFTGEYPIEPPK